MIGRMESGMGGWMSEVDMGGEKVMEEECWYGLAVFCVGMLCYVVLGVYRVLVCMDV